MYFDDEKLQIWPELAFGVEHADQYRVRRRFVVQLTSVQDHLDVVQHERLLVHLVFAFEGLFADEQIRILLNSLLLVQVFSQQEVVVEEEAEQRLVVAIEHQTTIVKELSHSAEFGGRIEQNALIDAVTFHMTLHPIESLLVLGQMTATVHKLTQVLRFFERLHTLLVIRVVDRRTLQNFFSQQNVPGSEG